MPKLSKSELDALNILVDVAEQELDRGDDWDELSDALDVLAPLVDKDWEKGKWHS